MFDVVYGCENEALVKYSAYRPATYLAHKAVNSINHKAKLVSAIFL